MRQMFLRFDSASLDDFRYAIVNDTDLISQLDWQSELLSNLKSVTTNHLVSLFLPQEVVLFTTVELPEKASRQLLDYP